MKANKLVKKCGPYYVASHSQGGGTVCMYVYPAFPEYDLSPKQLARNHIAPEWKEEPHWAEHRANDDGGGPSIFTAIATAEELAIFLNQTYDSKAVQDWQKRIKRILDHKAKETVFRHCQKCAYVTTAPRDWRFCPMCGDKLTAK